MSDAPQAINSQISTYPVVLSALPEATSAPILDVGAGEGFFSHMMHRRGYANVSACDYREEIWKCPEVSFTRADLNQCIPFPDESFDCVVAIEVIEHVENHFHFMEELVRVTRKGGRIVITTPNILALSSRWHFFLYGYDSCAPLPLDPNDEHYYLEHVNPISLPQILFHAERVGAELIELKTNRYRRGSLLPALALYPVLHLALRAKLLRRKHAAQRNLFRRHIRWILHPNNVMGRVTIAVIQRRGSSGQLR